MQPFEFVKQKIAFKKKNSLENNSFEYFLKNEVQVHSYHAAKREKESEEKTREREKVSGFHHFNSNVYVLGKELKTVLKEIPCCTVI